MRGGVWRQVRAFFTNEAVLVVAAVAALASCVAVPPDAAYAGYVDWNTLALLFCLMMVVAGFRGLGVLDAAGAWLVARAKTQRALVAALAGLVFFASMLVTNDVALITFVPLALTVLRRAHMEHRLCLVATLMTVAANLGSIFTPVGNPQNLYLFAASGMGVGEFLRLMAPYSLASGVLLAAVVAVAFRSRPVMPEDGFETTSACAKRNTNASHKVNSESMALPGCAAGHPTPGAVFTQSRTANVRFAVYLALFVACLAAVAGALDVRLVLALVLVAAAATDARLLARVDYGLLATFVALFVFVGNMSRLPLLHDALVTAVNANALLASVAASQVISNVPAAVLLSGFTDQWPALIVGTNLGGLGTLIASMASLITFKAVSLGRPGVRIRYLKVFTLVNAAFLTALLLLCLTLGGV